MLTETALRNASPHEECYKVFDERGLVSVGRAYGRKALAFQVSVRRAGPVPGTGALWLMVVVLRQHPSDM
jgi:hypothetical protein